LIGASPPGEGRGAHLHQDVEILVWVLDGALEHQDSGGNLVVLEPGELGRLRAHLDELTRLLKKGGELGKRLDFLIQELHREANTLGSKSAALELTNISVEMKVAIEQMREQVQNIE